MQTFTTLIVLLFASSIAAAPWFNKKKGPEYEINPNFGFRSYHQVRYEPMTVPFESEIQPQLPPIEFTLPVSTGSQTGSFLDGMPSASMNDYQAVPYPSDFNPSEFSSRQATNQYYY